jgi:hypothetical protein
MERIVHLCRGRRKAFCAPLQRPMPFSINGRVSFFRWPIRLALALGQGLSRGPLGLARSSDRARVWHHNVGRLPYGWTRAGGYQVGQERCPTTAEQGPRGGSSLLAAHSLWVSVRSPFSWADTLKQVSESLSTRLLDGAML